MPSLPRFSTLFVDGILSLALAFSANSIRRRIDSEREGLVYLWFLTLALQLHFRLEMGAACFGLVSSSPE